MERKIENIELSGQCLEFSVRRDEKIRGLRDLGDTIGYIASSYKELSPESKLEFIEKSDEDKYILYTLSDEKDNIITIHCWTTTIKKNKKQEKQGKFYKIKMVFGDEGEAESYSEKIMQRMG